MAEVSYGRGATEPGKLRINVMDGRRILVSGAWDPDDNERFAQMIDDLSDALDLGLEAVSKSIKDKWPDVTVTVTDG